MGPVNRRAVVAGVVLTGATALVLLIVCLLQDRPVVHLTLLFAFLLGAGRSHDPRGGAGGAPETALRGPVPAVPAGDPVRHDRPDGSGHLRVHHRPDAAVHPGPGHTGRFAGILPGGCGDRRVRLCGHHRRFHRQRAGGVAFDEHRQPRCSGQGPLPDEVGELAEAVDALARRLQASLSRERDLIRDVSHDLRTPLAAIRAMVESVNDGVVDDPETVRRYLRATESELEQLTRLINDLFDLSQMDAGALKLRIEPASIGDLISDTIESMSAQAAAHGLALDGRVDEDLPAVMMDAQRVQRVLNNLVDNAIRHTPPQGAIFIGARDVGPAVQVDVRDTGEGLPEEEVARLLDAAHGGDGSRSRPGGGSGLGLGIGIGIVQAHGGRIWLEIAAGEGSRFSFTLPKSSAGSPSDVPAI